MASTLYLTIEEKKVFEGLPEALRNGWQVEQESLTSFESDDDLRTRISISEFDSYPEVNAMLSKIQEGGSIENFSILDLPEEIFDEVMFTIGARGVSSFMRALLTQAKNDEDIQGLAGLSQIRHTILETNRSISYV